MEDARFKVCIFGDGGVGKTCLVNRYLTGLFTPDPTITLGVDFHVKWIDLEGKKIFLQLWDFAGEDRFRFILPTYIIGASGCIFMYDITRYSTFRNLDDWIAVFKEGVNRNKEEIPLIMVGGKLDLESVRTVPKEEVKEAGEKFNISESLVCSSKTGEKVEDIFVKITRIMMNKAGLL
jgi:small GTP-binding protein